MRVVTALLCGVVVAAASVTASAQGPVGLTQTLPPGFESVSTGSNTNAPFGVTYATLATPATGMRHQYCFDTSFIKYKAKQRINGIAFRQPAGLAAPGGTTSMVTITLSSSPLDMVALSNTFAANVGADAVQCFSGSIVWPAVTPAAPGAWVYIPFSASFTYDPNAGLDLIIDVVTADAATLAASNVEQSFGPARTQANQTSAVSATATNGFVTAALILLDYTPLPYMQASSSGGGVGDLTVSLTEMPGSVAFGWTLISTDTSFPLDSGPILGIYPSPTLFDIVAMQPTMGNPLAWVVGAPPGLYPTSTLFVNAGTLSFLAGQTWDFVAIALDGNGFFVARSNVARVPF
jgi:hypothetical protein